ncbi:MAG TPA: M20/M25/M40 family metallo-hydrolase [Burkholderiales bacterium]|nr:M20/M25/M40 family metallo-hydrolase [Burkholderiales bacterium]
MLFAPLAAVAQLNLPPVAPDIEQAMGRIAKHAPVVKALDAIKGSGVRMFEEQVRINEIPAPPFKEEARAKYYLSKLKEAGLADAYIDKEGNVIGLRRGGGKGPKLVVSAHLDTVFPEGTDVKVREKGGRYYAPGIGDDAAGLATLLTTLEHLNQAGVRTVGDIVFVGTVGEEELGDLRGMKALFRDHKDIDGFISLDGVGLGRIVNAATGSHRFMVSFKGPGGHSFSAFGLPSAIHAMGRAVAKIGDLVPPANPKTTFTVGTVRGGTSVNAISGDATIGIDVRSNSQAELVKFVEKVMAAIHEAVADENKRWNTKAQITVEIKQVGDRPAGSIPTDAKIVQAARAAMSAVGATTRSMEASSTDSNLPISLGVPAITLSSSGQAGGSHSLGEWYAPINNTLGPQNILLLSLALVGIEGISEPVLEKRAPRP